MAKAKEWALRCKHELQRHPTATFATLTYDTDHMPITLQKRHLQLWLKRLRKLQNQTQPIRFFACGEYGERNHRPHYHAILYNFDAGEKYKIEQTWTDKDRKPLGFTDAVPATNETISYVAGYTAKKIGYKMHTEERVDPETGELYQWEPPFILMSRRPGIGAYHRDTYTQSWREFAVDDGYRMPVPRYYHEAYKKHATKEDLEDLEYERIKLNILRDTSKPRLEAQEAIAKLQQQRSAQKRGL